MDYGFETEDMKKVFSNILMRLQESDEEETRIQVDLSLDTKSIKRKNTTPVAKNISATKIKTLNSASAKKIKAKDFESTTLARMNGQIQKKAEMIKKKQEIQKAKEVEQLRSKPDINQLSKKIGKRNEPVYERAEKHIKASRIMLEETKAKLLAEKEAKLAPELTFKPNITKSGNLEKRTTEEFFQYNLEWKRRSTLRTDQKREELEEKITSELKFTPEIDANSVNIVEQMGIKKPIEIRLLERQERANKRMTERRNENLFSFAPVIESRSRALVKKHNKEESVFNRLFSLSIDASTSHKSPKFGGKQFKSFSFTSEIDASHKSTDITFNENN